jgi:hypothetical protein
MRAFPILLTILLLGCSATTGLTTSPILADSQKNTDSAGIPQYQVWASGTFSWDSVDETLKFIPDRTAEVHLNVWPMLNPPKCFDCITIQIMSHDPVQKLLSVYVTLRNPTGLTGWFVRGVVQEAGGVELLDPIDGRWHSADQTTEQDAAPFQIFNKGTYGYPFGPYESYSADYNFRYTQLSGFAQCVYRVIVRYPESPGEPFLIFAEATSNTLTKYGGFLTVQADVMSEDTSPQVNVGRRIVYSAPPLEWKPMRYISGLSGNTYQGWIAGIPTSATYATIWIRAQIEGNGENYLAYKFVRPVLDVEPQPHRVFPMVDSNVGVFVDQLSTGMTDQQKEFMATHCAGSQKLVKTLADSLRSYNNAFIVLQYHLAFGDGDISNIWGNDWVKDWDFVNAQEDFFEHRSWSTQPNQRVLQLDWNWNLTDPTSDWVLYFIGNTLYRMAPLGEQFDGVFADSASQPWNTDPEKWWEGSDDPIDMFTYWTPKTQSFLDTVAQAYHSLPQYYYLIPNAGSYVTTISDITYYQCDGVMIEGFAHWGPDSYFTEEDWCLEMNRIHDLVNMNKIILCQTGVDVDNTRDRLFVLGSYCLVKGYYTYLNMVGPWSLEPQWWPEYDWGISGPSGSWTDISELQDAGGCYVQNYSNGIVIVNPSDETRYYTTTKAYSHTMYAAGGLLPEDGVPTGVATGPIVDAGVQEIPPHSTWLGAG